MGKESYADNVAFIEFDPLRRKWGVYDNLNNHHAWCRDPEAARERAQTLPRYQKEEQP